MDCELSYTLQKKKKKKKGLEIRTMKLDLVSSSTKICSSRYIPNLKLNTKVVDK